MHPVASGEMPGEGRLEGTSAPVCSSPLSHLELASISPRAAISLRAAVPGGPGV